MAAGKKSYRPLLAPGRHRLTLDELKDLTVDSFTRSKRRAQLFTELEALAYAAAKTRLSVEIWVDGSFLTSKREPDDIDFTLLLFADEIDALGPPEKRLAQDLISSVKVRAHGAGLHGFYTTVFRRDDPRVSASKADYWAEFWQTDRSDYLKGIAVLKFGDTDVGAALNIT